jgi:hypothetical protein
MYCVLYQNLLNILLNGVQSANVIHSSGLNMTLLKHLFSTDKKQSQEKIITVVSGLPRSGTSMMMRMLAASGMPLLTDQIRKADPDNPGGYFEYEPVKQLKEGEIDWLPSAAGKAVKVIATLLPYLPAGYQYRVILMQRAMPEILLSQSRMLVARGKDPDVVSDEEMARIFTIHLQKVVQWLENQPNVRYLEVSYNDLLKDPLPGVERLNKFFNGKLDITAMLKVIDPNLYRQRMQK